MRSLSSQAEQEMLEAAAANFGEGVVNLGRDPSMFGMESFTLSATFELNSLNGGDQRLLWNHTQYGIIVKDNDVRIALRGEDGKLNYYTAPDVLENAGWHDIQITYDAPSNELNIYLDGSAVFSTITSDVELSGPKYWDVTAGGTLWGRELDGNVADVSFHDEVLEIDASQSIAERMYTLDDGNLPELETPVETDQPASETPILSEQELLEAASANFGEGVVNLGRDPSMFGMESFTLSATFELNSLSGGDQALLWNHMQYGIRVKNDDVRIALRGEDGKLNYYTIPDVLKEAGWHDVQITYDASSNVLGMYLDGESVFSTITTDVEISGPKYWDVTAGGTLWGRELDGRVADVSFHDEVLQIDASQSIAERMYALDDGNLPEFETPVENTPSEISGEDTGLVTEDADLTASGKLTAEDVDAGESGFVAGSIAGVYGELSIDAAGNWAYTANDSAELQALGADDVVSDTLVVTTPDGTTHTITVTLEGVNDMPVITGVDTGSVAEDGPLQTTGKLAADDVDAGESGFAPGLVQGVYGVLSIDAAGNWAYNASGNTALQALGTGDVTAEKLTVFTVDGTAHVINISVSGSDDAAVISGVDTGVVEEDGVLTASGKLNAEDADAGESGFTAASVSGAYGMLVIDAAGNWTYTANDTPALQALGAGDVVTDTVVVKSIDGTTHNITISVEGSDDAPVISGVDTGVVEEDGVLTASGKLTADDADAGQSGFMAETVAGVYGELSIDAAGNWTYTAHDTAELQALGKGEMVTDTLTVATTDGTQKQILININGKDDASEISGEDTGLVTEDADLTASGKLTAEDVDAGESGFVAGSIAGVYGELSIDAAGNWAYTANDSAELQALGADDVVSDTLVVTTPDGTTHTITVTLEGVNDMPVITGVDTGSVAEDGPLQTTGKLAADDVDAGESGFAPGLVQGVYGVLSIDAAGNWAYNASGNTALQALGTGDVTAEKLTVFTVDGTAHVINISVSGSDDAAVISGVDTGVVEEDGVLTASGKLNAEDADAGESGFTAASVSGAYGMLVIDAAGNWTYTANDTPALQALGAGDVVTDTVVVKSIDGTTHNITISVEGSDDAPVISGVDTGVVEEDGVLTASGKLTADDADAGQSGFMAETVAGVYGELSIDAAGNWTYTAHDTAELQALGKGEMVTDTLTVATTDGTQKQILININGKDEATTTTPPTEEELLVQNAEALGADVVDLGRSADLFGMDNFTLSATFSLNSLNGGNQTLLWNHMQYGITVKDNDLQVALRGSDGNLDYINIKDVFSDTGWHDVQVVRNAAGNTLEIFVDGSNVHSQDATNFELTEPLYWNVTAGGTPWGDSFDGMLADVSVVRSAVEVDESASIYQRMYDMDANDVAKPLDVEMQETTGGSDANDVGASVPPAEEEDPVTEAEYVTVSSKEQLMSVIQSNPDGVSIKVAPGDYIGIDLVGLDAASGISISSLDPADPARFADVNISGSSNISFADIEFRADNSSEAFWGTHVVRVDGSSAISFEGSTFAGGPGMMNEGLFGLYVNHSSGVTVHSSEFTNTERGAMFSESDNLDIRGNYVHDLQSDGFDFSGVQNVVIDGNNFESFYPVEGDHADFIQFWLVGSDEGTENIQISNNFMAQGAGLPVQGIFITGSDTLANTNFSIENNVINQSAYHGITVMGVDGLELNNNTVLSSVGEQRDTWIMLESVTNGTVANNISTAFVEQNSSGISYENNLIADEAGFNGATYSELFQGHITQNSNNVELFELQGDVGAGADVYSILASNLGNSSGTNSDDLIEYTEGDQSISGFLGDDTLIGGSGDDVLFGGWGADHLTGGSGSDTFVFKNYFDSGLGTDRDVITDFDAVGNTDKIDISAIAFGDFKFSTGSEFTAQSFNENEKNVVLAEKADEFGAGVVNLGRDSSLFGSESMTISATFEMNSLAGGSQTVLYNHTQYSISVVDNSLQVGLRQSSGSILPLSFDNVITSPGWQDVQVVLDGTSNSLEIWMNGENLYSSNGHDIEIGDPLYWDVTAGGTPWGGALDGRVADVSVVDQAIDMSQINDLFDRTLHVDQFDEYLELDLSTGNTEVIFNEQDDVLSIDIDGDQNADMEIQLLGVSAVDLDASDFIT